MPESVSVSVIVCPLTSTEDVMEKLYVPSALRVIEPSAKPTVMATPCSVMVIVGFAVDPVTVLKAE